MNTDAFIAAYVVLCAVVTLVLWSLMDYVDRRRQRKIHVGYCGLCGHKDWVMKLRNGEQTCLACRVALRQQRGAL